MTSTRRRCRVAPREDPRFFARESARGSAARERAVDELGRLALWGEYRAGMLAVGVADVLMHVVAEEAVGSLTRERAVEAIG